MLLNRPWVLWDVADVEALLAKAVDRSPHVAKLRADERDELLCQLFEVAWSLSLRFDADRGSFSAFLYSSAQRRTVDWLRQQGGGRTIWRFRDRVHIRKPPEFVSLDADNSERDRLESSFPAGPGDRATGGAPAFDGLLADRRCTRARDLEEMGLDTA